MTLAQAPRGDRLTTSRREARVAMAPGIVMAAVAAIVSLGGHEALAAGPGPHPPAGDVSPSAVQVVGSGVVAKAAGEAAAGETILVNGRVTFDDGLVAHLASPVTGRVASVLAQPGQRVAKGAPLAVIDSPQLARAVPDELKAEADLAAAEGEYQRQRQLFDAHEGLADHLEAASTALALARAERSRARAMVGLVKAVGADEETGSFTVRAPLAGVVLATAAAPGAAVVEQSPGGRAAELFTVGTLDRVWVLGRISEADLSRARIGARVTVQAARLPGKTFAGRVEWTSVPDETSREATVRCVLANPDGLLRPGMEATIAIAAAGHMATAAPSGAVPRRPVPR